MNEKGIKEEIITRDLIMILSLRVFGGLEKEGKEKSTDRISTGRERARHASPRTT